MLGRREPPRVPMSLGGSLCPLAFLRQALETVKLDLDDLAPRIKEIRLRQGQSQEARLQMEVEMAVQEIKAVDGESN